MTDNEIIKAFKDFLNEQADGYTDHVETGGERYEFIEKELELLKETDNLINRQKAEKAEQQSEIAILKDSNKNLQELYYTEREKVKKAKQKVIDIAKALKTAKAEAVKEFAERLKEKLHLNGVVMGSNCAIVEDTDINNLVKETRVKISD